MRNSSMTAALFTTSLLLGACAATSQEDKLNEKPSELADGLGECDNIGYAGYCDGTTLVWCESGALKSYDCQKSNQSCGYQDDVVGNNCVDSPVSSAPSCAELGYIGKCDGSTLVWCEDGAIKSRDCAAESRECGYQDSVVGYNCLAKSGGGNPPGSGATAGFGYPVGDQTTYPAGGWSVTQVLGHYLDWDGFTGGHLAEDIAAGEAATANAPVYSVADGEVLYAGYNSSSYVNVVLIRHDLGNGESICSFYGHLGSVSVSKGQKITRGTQIANVLDWKAQFGGANSHLHYVLLSAGLCNLSAASSGASICGYDKTSGPNGIETLEDEPATYTSIGDACGDHNYPDGFIAPSKFISAHHF